MGCGGSKEAVATGNGANAGSSRCNRLLRRKSKVAATGVQKRSRAPQPSNNCTGDVAKANDEVFGEKKDKAIPSPEKAIEEEKEGITSNKQADQVVKDNKEAFAVKGDKATPTLNAIRDNKGLEIKKDEARNKDAKAALSVVMGKNASTKKAAEEKQEVAKKDEVAKDKRVARDQKADVASTENIIVEEKEKDINKHDVAQISTKESVKEENNEGHKDIPTEENEEATWAEDDIQESEEDSVTFAVAPMTEEDGSVTFLGASGTDEDGSSSVTSEAAPAAKEVDSVTFVDGNEIQEDDSVTLMASVIKEDCSATFEAAPKTKDDDGAAFADASGKKDSVTFMASVVEDGSVTLETAPATKDDAGITLAASPVTKEGSVTLAGAPTTKDKDDSGNFVSAPLVKEEEVSGKLEPSDDNEEARTEAELPQPRAVNVQEVVTEVDSTMEVEEEAVAEAVQLKPPEDNEEEKSAVAEEVVTNFGEVMEAEEEKVDTVEEINVEQEEKIASMAPDREESDASSKDEDGESDWKQTTDLKEARTTERTEEELGVPKNDDEKTDSK